MAGSTLPLKNIPEYHQRQQFCCTHDIFGGLELTGVDYRKQRREEWKQLIMSNYLPSIYIQV